MAPKPLKTEYYRLILGLLADTLKEQGVDAESIRLFVKERGGKVYKLEHRLEVSDE